jgi:NADPH-dependent F420 reductase
VKIAILGGTGKLGSGLAMHWAIAGHDVIIGSRSAGKAARVAAELTERLDGAATVEGLDNPTAATACQVAVLSVPYSAQLAVLESVRQQLAGKLLISVVVPLRPPRVSRAWRPEAGSAAQEAQELLGDGTPVVIAFQNISAASLADPDYQIDGDVLVCGDEKAHKAVAENLVADVGMRALDAGPLVNAAVVEGLTAVLIGLNARYGIQDAGVRITGLGR